MTLSHYEPFSTVDILERMANDVLRTGWGTEGVDPLLYESAIRCDLIEKEGEVIVMADMPGMDKKDIRLEAEGNHLILRGERKTETDEKSGSYMVRERTYGKYERVFHLPFDIDEKKLEAHFENGVLTVKIAKPETVKPKLIEIN